MPHLFIYRLTAETEPHRWETWVDDRSLQNLSLGSEGVYIVCIRRQSVHMSMPDALLLERSATGSTQPVAAQFENQVYVGK